MAKRNLYLKTTPVEEASEKYMKALEENGCIKHQTEMVSTYDCLGRITAKPVFAKCCSPLFNAAAMDGIAVKSAGTKGACESRPMILNLGEDYIMVDTGDPVKTPFDAVIMAEDIVETGSGSVQITESVPGWQHVRPIGEDIVIGEMIIPGHHTIRPVDIGVMLASGNLTASVFRKPKVGIIPTGTEIIRPNEQPQEGDIIDSNSGMFAAMVSQWGGIPKRYDIVEDDYENTIVADWTQDTQIVNGEADDLIINEESFVEEGEKQIDVVDEQENPVGTWNFD